MKVCYSKFNFFIGISFLLCLQTTYAINTKTQPKFTIEPLTQTNISIIRLATPTVKYVVTNKTSLTRTLTMVQISGITQTTGTGYCGTTFTLAPNQSCVLALKIIGRDIPGSLYTGGPKICKTVSAQNQAPDPFLCSKPSSANILNITITPTAIISSMPKILALQVGGGSGTIRVTNTSDSITATNVSALISSSSPLYSNVNQDSSNCKSIAPGSYCDIIFTPAPEANATSLTTFPIVGSNTLPTPAAIQLYDSTVAMITVSGSPLALQGLATGYLTITNSTSNTASNIQAILPEGLGIDQDASDCATLSANSSCTLAFNSPTGDSVAPAIYLIMGTNSSTDSAIIAVDSGTYSLELVSGSPLSLSAGGSGSMVVKNTSSFSLYDINAIFTGNLAGKVEQTGSTCPDGLATNEECTLTFTALNDIAPETTFLITGSVNNGSVVTSVEAAMSISYSQSYLYVATTSSITRCLVNVTTGAIDSSSDCVDADSDGTLLDLTGKFAAFTVDQDANYFYIVISSGYLQKCTISTTDGLLSNCQTFSSSALSMALPYGITINYNPNYGQKVLYFTDHFTTTQTIQGCYILSTTGDLFECGTFYSSSISGPNTFAVNSSGTKGYLSSTSTDATVYGISQCTINSSGNITACEAIETVNPAPFGLILNSDDSYLYNSTINSTTDLYRFDVSTSGDIDFTSKTTYSVISGSSAGITINSSNTWIYVMNLNKYLYRCPVDTSGVIGTCSLAVGTQWGSQISVALWNPSA